ncbi:YczE/YyaS/YitT family protein [Ferrimicrobium acidiphilum]|uniref:membrane protein YczE n=1 Tax=Ferrimicrobium acidiphilum TaxID=121039 RepID=UPI0023F5805E|nr:hypothetical protein [Ferrimicrobium acidiphilum]MCL5052352.1 hypothetical protein [Gammaproteobacteria bacterium]
MSVEDPGSGRFEWLSPLLSKVVAPLPQDRRARRIIQLLGGLVLYGVSDSLLVIARLGLDPWDVLNQGLQRHTGLPIGTWAILVGVVVLALWIPLRQRPGVGTLANVMLIGSTMDLVLSLAPPAHGADRWVIMFLGVALNAIATGLYIGGMLGPGPRDGLMLGISARGHSIRVVRTSIEATVLLTGWLLGGQVGFGTLTYAIAIGPLVHVLIPFLKVKST